MPLFEPPQGTPIATCNVAGKAKPEAKPKKKWTRQHKYQARKRSEKIQKEGYKPNKQLARKHLSNAQPIYTDLHTASLPVSKGGYTALKNPVPQDSMEASNIERLKGEGFQYIKADIESNAPRPVFDRNGLLICHIAPPPKDPDYYYNTVELCEIMAEESKIHAFSKDELIHKRGDFPAVNFGFTLPNGFSAPINLSTSHRRAEMLDRITSTQGFVTISNLQSSLFAFWNLDVYSFYKLQVDAVLLKHPELNKTSANTVFPTTACNFRNTCCYPHRDTQNCPFGWCAVTALGQFDHTRGGHLIMWELKLIVEFPHGWTILFPSATITHSNSPVLEEETRMSITQYCAGSLLRYADNGFSTDKDLKASNIDEYKKQFALKDVRWQEALKILSTFAGLKERFLKGRKRSIPAMFRARA